MEYPRLQDIDSARNEIAVRNGKGAKDRVTMLPEWLKAGLQEHLRGLKTIHGHDVADGRARVETPQVSDRKYPGAAAEWRWQWVFPPESRWKSLNTREEGGHPIDESLVQRAVKDAVRKAEVVKRATCHAFGRSFVTHVPEAGCDIRRVQELLGHQDGRPTMVYTHVLS